MVGSQKIPLHIFRILKYRKFVYVLEYEMIHSIIVSTIGHANYSLKPFLQYISFKVLFVNRN